MRTILAIVVISCFFVVASSQSSECRNRATDVATCISRLSSNTDIQAFCNECGNKLVSYYNDCAGGVGVDAVKQGKFWQLDLIVVIMLPSSLAACMHNSVIL